VGPRNHVIGAVEILPQGGGAILSGLLQALRVSAEALYAAKQINNGDSGTPAAGCNAPDWSMSHYIASRKQSFSAMRPFIKIL